MKTSLPREQLQDQPRAMTRRSGLSGSGGTRYTISQVRCRMNRMCRHSGGSRNPGFLDPGFRRGDGLESATVLIKWSTILSLAPLGRAGSLRRPFQPTTSALSPIGADTPKIGLCSTVLPACQSSTILTGSDVNSDAARESCLQCLFAALIEPLWPWRRIRHRMMFSSHREI